MDEQKVQINVNGDQDDPIVTVLTGQAAEVRQPNGYSFEGSIHSALEYYSKREFNKDDSVILVDFEKGTIKLSINNTLEPEAITISGKIEYDPLLLQLQINSNKKYRCKELSDLLKMNRIMFPEISDNMNLVTKLKSVKAKIRTILQESDDDKGNTINSLEQTLDVDLPTSFTIEWPIIKNGKKKKFEIDINRECTDAGVTLWLQSPEMRELFMSETASLISDDLKQMGDIVVIYK